MQRDARHSRARALTQFPIQPALWDLVEFRRGNPDGRSSPEQFLARTGRIEIMNKIKVVKSFRAQAPVR